MRDVCIYHGVDLDGFCSGAIWKTVHSDGDLIGLNYGQEIPWDRLAGNDVALLDFCLQPWGEMARLLREAACVTWIDHHKSAIESWKQVGCEFIRGVRDTEKAACELTWEFYYPDEQMPEGVFLLGDYDCWRHSDDDTMPYQMGMRLYDMDPANDGAMERWNKVFAGDDEDVFLGETLQAGRTILAYQTQQNEKAAKAIWFPVTFDNKQWMAVNQGGINSTFWDAVWDDSFAGKLSFVRSRNHWTVSLYSDAVDCSEIAKRHGGGGHPGASGFPCQDLPFALPRLEERERD
jgi:oligoribonuclease NrnB/cAMP/cGMP phosphodiesterase (DHH superfamily)